MTVYMVSTAKTYCNIHTLDEDFQLVHDLGRTLNSWMRRAFPG